MITKTGMSTFKKNFLTTGAITAVPFVLHDYVQYRKAKKKDSALKDEGFVKNRLKFYKKHPWQFMGKGIIGGQAHAALFGLKTLKDVSNSIKSNPEAMEAFLQGLKESAARAK